MREDRRQIKWARSFSPPRMCNLFVDVGRRREISLKRRKSRDLMNCRGPRRVSCQKAARSRLPRTCLYVPYSVGLTTLCTNDSGDRSRERAAIMAARGARGRERRQRAREVRRKVQQWIHQREHGQVETHQVVGAAHGCRSARSRPQATETDGTVHVAGRDCGIRGTRFGAELNRRRKNSGSKSLVQRRTWRKEALAGAVIGEGGAKSLLSGRTWHRSEMQQHVMYSQVWLNLSRLGQVPQNCVVHAAAQLRTCHLPALSTLAARRTKPTAQVAKLECGERLVT